ncbi:FYDLN acid domain-containing protein [Sphingomicrobium aestuariivivum]|uniref:FYDLN acid domain-containing protein n=1 Tax=Sphingomicrobium aestuariivivum TaxID=1582356 RepID=UPI001FD6A7FF|nr:FYDLN acid domain-containing protein [Sphingomicrobium aestuariivivum]MCJ8190443.1 FYDLN acid domain-containing protein [Sphingomicrobium aestuariivivum]
MVKPEWGTKRTCPKCGTRFYDLGNDEPVSCIECDAEWIPEPVLKSKQPLPFDDDDKKKKDEDLAGDDLDDVEDDDGGSADDDVDLDTGDAGVTVTKDDDGDDEN